MKEKEEELKEKFIDSKKEMKKRWNKKDHLFLKIVEGHKEKRSFPAWGYAYASALAVILLVVLIVDLQTPEGPGHILATDDTTLVDTYQTAYNFNGETNQNGEDFDSESYSELDWNFNEDELDNYIDSYDAIL